MGNLILIILVSIFVISSIVFFWSGGPRSVVELIKSLPTKTNTWKIKTQLLIKENKLKKRIGRSTVKIGTKNWNEHPNVRRHLEGIKRIYRMQVIDAIYNGTQPPEQVGFGHYTRETLLRDWNDDWQELADSMGIKLFKKVNTVGTPGWRWVDARPEKTLNLPPHPNPPVQGSSSMQYNYETSRWERG